MRYGLLTSNGAVFRWSGSCTAGLPQGAAVQLLPQLIVQLLPQLIVQLLPQLIVRLLPQLIA